MSFKRLGASRGRKRHLGGEYVSWIMAESPLFFHRYDETSGTATQDFSGNGRTGTLTGSNVTLAQPGLVPTDPAATSLKLTGSTYDLLANASWMNFTAGIGISIILKPETAANNAGIVSRWQNSGGGSNDWLLWFDTSQQLTFLATIGGNSTTVSLSAGLPPNVMAHIFCGYDGAHMLMYINGVLAATTAVTGALAAGAGDIQVGSYNGSAQSLTNHYVDEVALFDHMPSADRIAQMYQAATVLSPAA